MPIDVIHLIGAVNPELSTRDKDGSPARPVVAARIYNTTLEDLRDALANPLRGCGSRFCDAATTFIHWRDGGAPLTT